ncbi:biopolymer transporter ExbD [Vibrio sp. 10N.286.49.C2]|uniref:ExbD/TolR family protein n=1 Tax=unclassified Vibrio TaxID=2614977 RepID=UPI000C817699|nr:MULTISPECIES: biopolymer transporter ExbD [unclassified Vibrio]PMH43332.1 biopolymer transporter ExbD [Vibrio sp. 10N.286.49.C2]PMH56984.1 biopolymer transporter ExbD [Vibrio sp. 10N.286.49.B1]PMH79120.1 biopolymer transporter ExbD [Vibrio sp. 10N.286.48.B7]
MIKISEPSKNAPLYPDLTPLLDIIFIVMVFLMLTASVRLESLDVALPATDSNLVSAVETESLTVNILTSSPYWALNSKEYIDWDNFKVALLEEAKSTNRPIIIAADKAAEVQHLVKLLAFMQDNGIPATQLLTEEAVN